MASKKNICPWCGIVNPNDAVQCIQCGSDLNPKPKEAETSRPADEAAAPAAGKAGRSGGSSPAPAPSKQAGKAKPAAKREPGASIPSGIIYAAVAAAVIFGYLFLRDGKTEQPEVPQNTSLMQADSSVERIRSMEQALESNPADKQALLAYANTLHDARQFPKAIAAYKKYLALAPKDADARVDMGICLFESGDSPAAITELKKALEYEPKHQPAMFNLGVVYLNQEKVKESNDWFSRCAAVDPSTPLAARAKQLLSQHSSTNKNLQ